MPLWLILITSSAAISNVFTQSEPPSSMICRKQQVCQGECTLQLVRVPAIHFDFRRKRYRAESGGGSGRINDARTNADGSHSVEMFSYPLRGVAKFSPNWTTAEIDRSYRCTSR